MAKKRFAENDPTLLTEIRLEYMDLPEKEIGKTEIPLSGVLLYVPQPVKQDTIDMGTRLQYSEFTVSILKAVGGSEMSSLPVRWGRDDLDKMRYICSASGAAIDSAATSKELEEAVTLLTARGTIINGCAFNGAAWITTPTFEGLLLGDFSTPAPMDLYIRPKAENSRVYRMIFKRVGSGTRADVVRFLETISATPER